MTVCFDGFEVFCVGVLVGVFEQGALQGLLCVPGLWPRLQVLLYGLGDAFVVGRDDLCAVFPVDLRQRRSGRRPMKRIMVARHTH